ncbi:MAG TPA: hypothetical protein VK211_08680, partial [Kamptonema sp.]|nr:hypothetical protein [Kamptonema sp.]
KIKFYRKYSRIARRLSQRSTERTVRLRRLSRTLVELHAEVRRHHFLCPNSYPVSRSPLMSGLLSIWSEALLFMPNFSLCNKTLQIPLSIQTSGGDLTL